MNDKKVPRSSPAVDLTRPPGTKVPQHHDRGTKANVACCGIMGEMEQKYTKIQTMQERNVIGGFTAVLISPMVDFYSALAPYLILALVLIFLDLRWGIAAARSRGESIRTSRAWRRTINKMVDYICWVTLAGLFGQAFGEILGIPILAAIMMLVIYGIELNSCFSNYFVARGVKWKVNVFKFFSRKTDIIEPNEDE